MADVDLDAGGFKQTFKDLFAGAAGGVAQVLLGKLSSVYNSLSLSFRNCAWTFELVHL